MAFGMPAFQKSYSIEAIKMENGWLYRDFCEKDKYIEQGIV